MRTFKRERYYALRIIHEVIQGREKRHSAIVSLVLKIGGALELTFFLGLGTIKGKLSRRQKLKIKETIQKSTGLSHNLVPSLKLEVSLHVIQSLKLKLTIT